MAWVLVPRRRTEKNDWVSPLERFISTQYSAAAAAQHKAALTELQATREDLRVSAEKNESIVKRMLDYYLLLGSVSLRFPISENNVRMIFYWYSAFNGKKAGFYDVWFERTSVLFNVACVYAEVAALENIASDEGVKLAAKYFQLSASAFQRLRDDATAHGQQQEDLKPEGIDMLICLMQAQAQECFYEKARKGNMKPSVTAKLAQSAADLYDRVFQALNGGTLKTTFTEKSFVAAVELKASLLRSEVYQRASEDATASGKYGLIVAYSRAAVALLAVKPLAKAAKQCAPELQQMFKLATERAAKALASAEKDNDTIYHEQVARELPVVESITMVKTSALEPPPRASDPFAALEPFAMRQQLLAYKERKNTLVSNELSVLNQQNEAAKNMLSSMNLPGAVEALEATKSGVPKGLEEKMSIVLRESGYALILDLLDTSAKLAREDAAICDEAIAALDNEEKDDAQMRQAHGARWTRTPSHALTSTLRQEANKHRANIEHARKSDAFVLGKWKDAENYVRTLNSPQSEVLAMLPQTAGGAAGSGPAADALKAQLYQLDAVVAEREQLRAQLVAHSEKDDPTADLLAAGGGVPGGGGNEAVFERHLLQYGELQGRLQQNYVHQRALSGSIAAANGEFVRAKGGAGGQMGQREHILNGLDQAFKTYQELKGNLREGVQFYTNFQELLKQFRGKCCDFAFARQTEKQDLLQSLQQQPSPQTRAAPPPQMPYGAPPPQQQQQPAASAPTPYPGQPPYASPTPYPGAVPYGVPYGTPQGVPYGAPQGVPYGTPQGMPYGAPQGMPYGAPQGGPYGGPAPYAVSSSPYAQPQQQQHQLPYGFPPGAY